jgi:hypothetical protein
MFFSRRVMGTHVDFGSWAFEMGTAKDTTLHELKDV